MSDLTVSGPRSSGGAHAGRARPGRIQGVVLIACAVAPVISLNLPILLSARISEVFAGTPGVMGLVALLAVGPALVAALFAPLAGRLIDSFGRVRLLIGALLLDGAAGTMPLWIDSLALIVAGRLIVGLTSTVVVVCVLTLLGDRYRGVERDRYFGLNIVVGTIAALAVDLAVGTWSTSDWRTPFLLHGVSVALVALVALFVPERRGITRAGARRLSPLAWRRLGPSCAATVLGGILFYCTVLQLPVRLVEVGAAATEIGLLGAVAAAGTVIGALSYIGLGRFGPDRLLPAAFGLGGAGVIVMGAGPVPTVVVTGAVLASVGCGLLLPTVLTLAVGSLNLEQRGRSTGWWTACFSIAPVLVLLSVRTLGGPLGGPGGVLVAIGIAGLVLAAVLPRVVRAIVAVPHRVATR